MKSWKFLSVFICVSVLALTGCDKYGEEFSIFGAGRANVAGAKAVDFHGLCHPSEGVLAMREAVKETREPRLLAFASSLARLRTGETTDLEKKWLLRRLRKASV